MNRNKRVYLYLLAILVVLSVGSSIVSGAVYFMRPKQETVKQETETKIEPKEEKGSSSFTFAGVGDNLIHQAIFSQYEMGVTDYDFKEDYALMKPYIEAADLSFINQETICAGEEFGLSHYPQFNGPTQILDAVADTGFDWLAASSNHSLDKGSDALLAELNYLHENYPDISVTGAYRSEEESNQYIVREVNGIKVGLLGYTYGLNGIPLPEDMPWLVELINEDQIQKDMEALSKISDVQIVSMHWGTEYHTEIEADQQALAQKMNEWGVEVIIGTHPHVIKPAEIIQGEKQDTLCYYSLGNFLSAQDTNEGMVGGMASFTLQYDFDTQETSFKDVKFTPTVMYYDPAFTTFKVMTIHDYNDDYIPSHYVASLGYDMSKAWIQNYVKEIMGSPEGIEVVVE
ncbi:CapA family protein [Faecalicoccus pleomorphus]|uniref:CapA family protein n=1 Tax=Faecalicoccus pleomorphus TaxID=1323 RepID=UPI00232A989D|nr:CapA family protein [Faecalicoccus pleomorphus]MDB7986496.1 CapA family protein [Faecalicoccus pleomorphus]MDB7990055.1 CapA family protein [Faecalicoccus pleomorphus]MDM8293348.1 CapA family protein [Faecalicoccus pleomorphus]